MTCSQEAEPSFTHCAERVARTRHQECPQLLEACYLDAAASPPFPAALAHRAVADLTTTLYANPHSRSPSAVHTANSIEHARARVINELFSLDEPQSWELVFTSGATASLKLVGEAFDWTKGDFHHLLESHTSLAGIRDLASKAGARAAAFEACHLPPPSAGRSDLVGLPLQCNATGARYEGLLAELCDQPRPSYVLIDAASYLSSSQRLDLGRFRYETAPDFVAFSFYKVFGYPTGLGGLLVKKSSAHALCRKTFYGGGTLDAVAPWSSWRRPRKDLAAAFEDGTVNIHAILALPHAFGYYQDTFGHWQERADYVRSLTRLLYRRLGSIRHGNGAPVVRIYSSSRSSKLWAAAAAPSTARRDCSGPDDQGPILNFNLLSPSGRIVPPNEVDRLASISNIHLRAGRHCNVGFVASALGVTEDDLKQQYANGVGCDESSDSDDVVSTSLRASLCLLNTDDDIERLGRFIERFFRVADLPFAVPANADVEAADVADADSLSAVKCRLSQIVVYPIKSCAGQQLREGEKWPLTRQGLQYDREWVLLNLRTGKGLSQKKHPRMALIQPRIDRQSNMLVVAISGRDRAQVALEGQEAENKYERRSDDAVPSVQVCTDAVRPSVHLSVELTNALSDHLGVPCTLARQRPDQAGRHSKLTLPPPTASAAAAAAADRIPLLLSNESPFLLINQASVEAVSAWLVPQKGKGAIVADDDRMSERLEQVPLQAQASSFRSNFVVSDWSWTSSPSSSAERIASMPIAPFFEDRASRLRIGKNRFGVLGQCRRCQMVCVDQDTGEIRPETFKALAKHRRNDRGRIIFGSHLVWLDGLEGEQRVRRDAGVGSVAVGMPVSVEVDVD